MSKKEELAKEFAPEGRTSSLQLLRETSFIKGWDACMEYLSSVSFNVVLNELVKYSKTEHFKQTKNHG